MRYKKKRKSSIKEVVLLILIVVIGFSIVITQGIFLNKSISIHRIVKISQFKISYNYLKSVTVIIKDYINNKYTAMGTGVIIKYENGYTYIITDFHVINVVGNDIRIQNGLRQRYVEIVKINKKKDLALIRIFGKLKNKGVIKGFAFPIISEKIYNVGHHLGRLYIYGEGVISGWDRTLLLVQIPDMFGDSGSGIFNSQGKLIALVDEINLIPMSPIDLIVDSSHSLCISNSDIQSFLRGLKNDRR